MENKYEKEIDFNDVLILPQFNNISSPSQVILERTFTFSNNFIDSDDEEQEEYINKNFIQWTGIPLIASNDTTGTFEVYNILKKYKMLTALNKSYKVDDYIKAYNSGIDLDTDYFMVSTGITDENYINLKEIMLFTNCKWICIDSANAYTETFVNFCKKIREDYPCKIIVAGNVLTSIMAEILVQHAGINIVKIGVENGASPLITRQFGVGRPHMSALNDCSKQCKNLRGLGYTCYTVSDSFTKSSGDISKAFATGADFVTVRELLTKNEEIIEETGIKSVYNMFLNPTIKQYFDKIKNYSSSSTVSKKPYKSNLDDDVNVLLDDLRRTCASVGAQTIEILPNKTEFVSIK